MEKMVEKKYIAPNAITAANMLLGYLSIIMSIRGNIDYAIWSIFLAMVCDGLDGKTARKLDAFSEFGKEFDSFSDAISFGIAPNWERSLHNVKVNFSFARVIPT